MGDMIELKPGDFAVLHRTWKWIAVKVEKADGTKCQRCWVYSTHVGESAEHPTLCDRCVEVVS